MTDTDPTDASETDNVEAAEPVAGTPVATEAVSPVATEAVSPVATEAGKPAATTPVAADASEAGMPVATEAGERAARKVREGVAVSTKMDKTVVVAVVDRVRHPKYAKYMQRTKKLYAHDEAGEVSVGDRVRVMETRPLSKLKRWRVVEVLERAK
jgi:small subunit ribosomal protein S17